jgi:hypothetical protein
MERARPDLFKNRSELLRKSHSTAVEKSENIRNGGKMKNREKTKRV